VTSPSAAAIIAVGLNENVSRAQQPNVPLSPAECATDATRCLDAGASVIHWHARDPVSGAPRLGDTDLYAEALAPMRSAGLLAYPTYPIDTDSVDGRLGHCFELRRHHGLELTPLDVGSVTIVPWDGRGGGFGPDVEQLRHLGVVENPLPFLLDALDRINDLGLRPVIGAFDLGFTRTAVLLAEAGRLPTPFLLQIFLSGSFAVGPFPSVEALDLHVHQLPAGLDVEWNVVPHALDDPALIERLCRAAFERGGGVRVGLGDNPRAYRGRDNASLVREAAGWAEEAGREVATPTDVRRRLALDSPTPRPGEA
jgi:3-keto-5-aminohexanoate cleavage enzyme